jgi:23S rRNA (adenine2503-C2)-methyltransferase
VTPPAGRAQERGDIGNAVHLLDLDRQALRDWFAAAGQPPYRADQLLDWVYAKGAASFAEMTNLPKQLRAWAAEHCAIHTSAIARELASTDGARKLLLTWPDGAAVETVWIPEAHRQTVCVSSQVGCPVGCQFCASGLGGLQRNLTAGEIVEQVLHVRRLLRATTQDPAARLSNVVFMGMGEPLANYAAVLKAVRTINAPWGLGIGARKITISTVGLPKQIRQLAEEDLQLNLALSLHAPTEELRRELIPWAKVPLQEVLEACQHYFERTGRELTLEYVLLAGVNDHPIHARQLAMIARRLRANVNVLRYNPVPGLAFERPSSEVARKFQELLRASSVNAHVRTSRGQDISAACGQLRRGEAL